MIVSAVCAALAAEMYALGVLSPKCLAVAISVLALVVGVSALRQMGRAEISAIRKFAGLVVAAIICLFTGVRVWPVLAPGVSQVSFQFPAFLLTSKSHQTDDSSSSSGEAKDKAEGKADEKDKAQVKEPVASAPVQPGPVLDVAALQVKCDGWAKKAPRYARELYAPDPKDEPGWIVEARQLDHEVTRSFEALKVKVDQQIRASFATLSDKDKEYVDVLRKNWARYEDGTYRPPYYDFNGLIGQIASPHLDNSGIGYLVSVITARIKNLDNLKVELSIIPGFSL